MPQAESNEIPYNTSDGSSFPVPLTPHTISAVTSTAGRSFLYFWVALALVLGIVTVLLIAYKADEKTSVSVPTKPSVQSLQQPPAVPRPRIRWQNSYSSGLALAKREGKKQMIYFYTDWCEWCQKMEKETFADEELVRFLKKFVPVKINGDKDKQTLKKFAISGYPTIVFTDREENVMEKIVGFFPARSLREKMEIVLSRREKASQGEKPTREEKPQVNAETPQNIQAPAQGEQRNAEVAQEKNVPVEVASPSLPNNESPIRYHELAHSYEKQGDLEKAAAFFRKAVELAPDDWRHRRCFGIFLTRTGNLSEAIRQLERASELNPEDPGLFHQLGHILWKGKEYQRSVLSLERAIQLAQDNQQYSACAAKAYYLLGLRESNPDLSRSYLKKALYYINKIPYRRDMPTKLRDLKAQISRAYSVAVKNSLAIRSSPYGKTFR